MKLSSVSSTATLVSQLRTKYLAYLYEPQDLYSELLNKDASYHILMKGMEAVGYYLISCSGTLLEFYVSDELIAEAAFDYILHTHSISQAIVKTFDPMLLSLSLTHAVRVKPIALVFTTIAEANFKPNQSITCRLATKSDLTAIISINDGFFDSKEEVQAYIENCQLFLYEENHDLIGCGLIQPVISDQSVYDIGMLVKPSRRRQGLGEYIVHHLKTHCLSNSLRPVCCCDIENSASRACLEAAGFRSRHRTLEFSF